MAWLDKLKRGVSGRLPDDFEEEGFVVVERGFQGNHAAGFWRCSRRFILPDRTARSVGRLALGRNSLAEQIAWPQDCNPAGECRVELVGSTGRGRWRMWARNLLFLSVCLGGVVALA